MRMKSLLLPLILLFPGLAFSFTLRMHVYAANDVLRDVRDDGQVNLGVYGSYAVNPEVREALIRFPEYYRGGAIGPDGYPDIFTGQVFTHTDQSEGLVEHLLDSFETSCDYALQQGWCQQCVAGQPTQCQTPNDSLVPFSWEDNGYHFRPKRFWRSIDWARYLINAASTERNQANAALAAAQQSGDPAAIAAAIQQRDRALQAVAFAHGYMTHYAGDGFGHGWVNLYAGGAWDYFDPYPEYEYRHVIVEGYLQHVFENYPEGSPFFDTLPPDAKDLTINAPDWFIEKYIMRQVVANESDSGAPSAAHIRMLYGYRELLEEYQKKLGLETLPPPPASPDIDIKDPRTYSSIWSFIINRCAADLALGVMEGPEQSCARLYQVVLREYINERMKRTDAAILGWVTLSTNILREGFLSEQGFEPAAIRDLATGYYNNQLLPVVVPGEDEQLRQFLRGFSCVDVGPPNFEKVCEAMMARVTKAVEDVQDELEARLRQKFASYLDAFDVYLCTLEDYAKKFAEPDKRMSFAYCGHFDGCPLSLQRIRQVQTDVFIAPPDSVSLSGADPRNFIPFRNTVRMSKLALLRQIDLGFISIVANTLPPLEGLPLIDPNARFLRDSLYQSVLYESIATLDGKEPSGDEDNLQDPNRVLFDQFRKAPVFALIANEPARNRIHWPLFEQKAQDPDGDQLLLSYDLCPCWPETRTENARDSDGDGVGNGCDIDFIFPDAAQQVQALPDAGFGPPANGIKTSFVNRLRNTVEAQCLRESSEAAALHLDNMLYEIRAHTENGIMDAPTSAAVTQVVTGLISRLRAGAVACADMPAPGTSVTSCKE